MSNSGDIVSEICGDWGRWQLRTVFLIFLCKIPSSFFMACIIFTAPYAKEGEYTCLPPRGINISNRAELLSRIHPIIGIDENNQTRYDHCYVYEDYRDRLRGLDYINGSNVVPCENFVHNSPFQSIVTEFDAVCDRFINLAWTQFWHLFGVLVGGIIATYLMKFISPRRVMLIGIISQIMCGSLTGLVSKLDLHSFMRTVSAICCAQMYTSGQVIFADITGGNYRKSVLCLFETFWGFGVLILALIGYYIHNWTEIYLIISLPTTFYIILWYWIPDSPRWLLRHGHIDEAKAVLLSSAIMNNRKLVVPIDLDERLAEKAIDMTKEPESLGWWSLWMGPKAMVTMVALHLAWSIYVTNYNGMLLNVRAFGRQYLYVNTALAGISEIIGVLIAWYFVVETKQKWLWTGAFNIVAGIVSCLGLLLPGTLSEPIRMTLVMTTAMIPKAATTCSQTVLMAATAELVPPVKQRICIFSCITWARIWLLTAPFIGLTTKIHYLAPLIAFGQLGLIGGIATCCINRWQNNLEINTNAAIKDKKEEIWTAENTRL